jgi:hypothetical protein
MQQQQRIFRLIASIVMACWSIHIHYSVVFQSSSSSSTIQTQSPKIAKRPSPMWVGAKGRSVPLDFEASPNYITSPQETRKLIPQLITTESSSVPLVYVITQITHHTIHDQVYGRAQLVRLAQTLQLDGGIYWIVVANDDDNHEETDLLSFAKLQRFLYSTGIPFAHVTTLSALQFHLPLEDEPNQTLKPPLLLLNQFPPGIVYVMNWKHAYDYRLFTLLRHYYVATTTTTTAHPDHYLASTLFVLDPNSCISFWNASDLPTTTTSQQHHPSQILREEDTVAIPTTNMDALSKIVSTMNAQKNKMKKHPDVKHYNSKNALRTTFQDWLFEPPNQSSSSSSSSSSRIVIHCTIETTKTPYVWHLPTYKDAKKFQHPPRGRFAAPPHYGKLASEFP